MKVNFATPISSSMGYAEMGRRIWSSLCSSFDMGAVHIPMQEFSGDLGPIAASMKLATAHKQPDYTIVNMVPILWSKFATARTIGCTTFEADRIPQDWMNICNKQIAVITTSDWNRQVMISSGVTVPIYVVSPAFTPVSVTPKNDGKFRFYSSFQWSVRKNPEGLLRAFIGAFDGKTDVELVLKTHIGSGDEKKILSDKIAHIASLCGARAVPSIKIVSGNISAAKNTQIAQQANAHISLSLGEGWGLPAWEAAEAGQPLISTNWGAYSDWAGLNPYRVQTREQPIYGMEKSISPFYNGSMRWGDPSICDAIDKMRWIASNYDTAKKAADTFGLTLASRYSLSTQNRAVENIRKTI